ncbi:MAG: prepilin-type N-terminal cleavage/methylation domain-containing protein [Verrucomicrobia bacterium]|nr:prepilin-type N-terminal cleavage/methylation domain-containing protein [Verrucomicrobiota bacterium]
MKTAITERKWAATRSGFTLVEALVGIVLLAIMFTVFYVGITAGFGLIQLARENLRATQILQEKTETLRLLTWEELGQMQRHMTEPFYAPESDLVSGLSYDLRIEIPETSPVTDAAYAADIRLVTVQASWMSGGTLRRRSMSTYVSRYGLHRYRY